MESRIRKRLGAEDLMQQHLLEYVKWGKGTLPYPIFIYTQTRPTN
jgi:hypothetical protein